MACGRDMDIVMFYSRKTRTCDVPGEERLFVFQLQLCTLLR